MTRLGLGFGRVGCVAHRCEAEGEGRRREERAVLSGLSTRGLLTCFARAEPTSSVRRVHPPAAGIKPNWVSGSQKRAAGPAIRTSHASAHSKPPATAAPGKAGRVGAQGVWGARGGRICGMRNLRSPLPRRGNHHPIMITCGYMRGPLPRRGNRKHAAPDQTQLRPTPEEPRAGRLRGDIHGTGDCVEIHRRLRGDQYEIVRRSTGREIAWRSARLAHLRRPRWRGRQPWR